MSYTILNKSIDISLERQDQLFKFCTVGEHHTFLDHDVKVYPKQGWKIHISCFFDNYEKILKQVGMYCSENRIALKYINTKKDLFNLLSKHANRVSAGKFITIYPINESEFVSCIRDLYELLKNEKGPYILTDKRYLDCKVLYYRYGVIQYKKGDEKGIVYDGFGKKVADIEGPFYSEKKGIVDPLFENKLSEPSATSYLFTKYSIDRAIQHTNGGGVYLGVNKKTGVKVIIKEARPFIGISKDDTVIKFRKQEEEKLLYLYNLQYVPKLIECFYEWEHFYLIQEYVEGETLRNFSYNYSPVVFHESLKSKLNENYNVIGTVIDNLLVALFDLHARGVALVDISPDNVIVDEDLNVYFIDLEDCFIQAFQSKASYSIPNVQFSNNQLSNFDIFNQDKHKVGYLIMSILCSANEMLSMDKTGGVTLRIFNEFSRRYSLPIKMYETILNLIYNPDFSLIKRKEYTYPTDQSNYSLSEDYKVLLKSIKTAEIDCTSTEEFCGLTYIEHDATVNIEFENLSLVNQCLYLIKESSYSNNPLIMESILSKERELKEYFSRFMKDRNYSLTEGSLAVAYFYLKLYEKTMEEEFLSNTLYILLGMNDVGKYINQGKLIPNTEYTCSPYMKYTSGYIRIGLMYLQHRNNESLKSILKDYLKGIDNNFPKNPSYLNGLSGIADTFIEAYKYYGDTSYLQSALDKYAVIRLFKLDDDSYPCNDLENVNLGFNNGMLGILHFYNNLSLEAGVVI